MSFFKNFGKKGSGSTRRQSPASGWRRASELSEGMKIAVAADNDGISWDEIVSISPAGREKVFDIEVEGTHNFIGNDIVAHNTYILRAGGVTAKAPDDLLAAAGDSGMNLSALATYTLAEEQKLAAELDAESAKMTSLESRISALESGQVASAGAVSGGSLDLATSTILNALKSFGVLIQKGIAQFNTLVFRQLVASKDADGTSSAGSVSIVAGNKIALVENTLVKPTTKVFVTFNSEIAGSWWVSDKAEGSFRVVLSSPQSTDVSFDYFLVQTEGQIAVSSPTDGTQQSTASGTGTRDVEAPIITLIGDNPLRISVGGTFVDPGILVSDNSGEVVPVTVYVNGVEQASSADGVNVSVEATYVITYVARDTAGNNATATRSVIVGNPSGTSTSTQTTSSTDTTPPTVTLNGAAAIEIQVGSVFSDPGATASDVVDGDLTAAIVVEGTVDTATAGVYTLTYKAIDAAGNIGSASRVVSVVEAVQSTDTTTTATTTQQAAPSA